MPLLPRSQRGRRGRGEEGEPPQQQRSPADERRSKRRSRAAVWDYVQCNPELDTFVTLTLSARSVDRYDYSAIVALLRIGERRPPIPRKSIHNFGTETTAFSCLLGGKHLVFAVCKVPDAVPLSCGLRRKTGFPTAAASFGGANDRLAFSDFPISRRQRRSSTEQAPATDEGQYALARAAASRTEAECLCLRVHAHIRLWRRGGVCITGGRCCAPICRSKKTKPCLSG